MTKETTEEVKFEKALERLEKIVEELEKKKRFLLKRR